MATKSKKFIPNGDADFSEMAWKFARCIAHDCGGPRKYAVADEDARDVHAAVEAFRGSLQKARHGGRRSVSMADTAAKDAARKEAERIIRRLAGAIRSNPDIAAGDKALLGIKVASAKRGRSGVLRVPGESPVLVFKQAIHRSVHVPEHELVFSGRDGKGKPAGATRLELFVELVNPEDPVPSYPGASVSASASATASGGGGGGGGGGGAGIHYLRSYARSPIRLVPPMADRAMRVVYWGRWADASGEVGPFSAAAAGWVEGGSHHLMGPQLAGGSVVASSTTALASRMLPTPGSHAPGSHSPGSLDPASHDPASHGPGIRPESLGLGSGPGSGQDPDTSGAAEQRMRVMVAVMQTQQRFLESSAAVRSDAAVEDRGQAPKRLDAA